jgi:formamidopyrimidine-DNA glycosylase
LEEEPGSVARAEMGARYTAAPPAMPELPEVETVRRDLAPLYTGRVLERLVVTGRRTVRRHPPEMLAALEGRTLTGTGRHGKYLLLEWDDGQVLVVHLRMSGQLLAAQPGDPALSHTHAVMTFGGAGELRFVDPRTFGEFFLATPAASNGSTAVGPRGKSHPRAPDLAELEHLGPDALEIDEAGFRASLAGRRAPLKALIVDQRVTAGIGNIYADEICFEARLRPDRHGGSLKKGEIKRLTSSAHSVLESAIAARGSSLADEQYRDLQGAPGLFQLEHKVYGRRGQGCVSCGREIVRVHFGAKSAYLCPKCQK